MDLHTLDTPLQTQAGTRGFETFRFIKWSRCCLTGSLAICMAPVLSQRSGVGASQEIPKSANNHRSHTISEVVVASAHTGDNSTHDTYIIGPSCDCISTRDILWCVNWRILSQMRHKTMAPQYSFGRESPLSIVTRAIEFLRKDNCSGL